ncbi:hypothetical protein H2198_005418 [Neophaeococcomyces mojaviensis]|uniref:Uncharacterized protein n=1 Tax=Neophaeococcomyces mojaviensis TaxID=3383035 RepID=A0ACC3A5V7_9EURO|nr:hypothetical protein H2198_005418 [Knufia sp. JES_112]
MLPSPSTAVLGANPNFANLYNHLIANVLDRDGSTLSATKDHDQVIKALNESRKTAARDVILLRALEEVAIIGDDTNHAGNASASGTTPFSNDRHHDKADELPSEICSLTLNIASYLSASLDPEASQALPSDTNELIADELEAFHNHIPQISKRVSKHLTDTESQLASLASPLPTSTQSKPDSKIRLPRNYKATPPSLPEALATLTSSTTKLQDDTLPSSLTNTATNLTSLLTSHTESLHRRIRHLELTTHGTQSRHLTSRSTYLRSVSRGIELKALILRLDKEKTLYSNEALLDRMSDEYEALQSKERKLIKRERELQGLLAQYEEAGQEAVGRNSTKGQQNGSGEDVFRVLGERYAEIEEEIDAVKADVERLEGTWVRPRESRGR